MIGVRSLPSITALCISKKIKQFDKKPKNLKPVYLLA